MINRLVRLRPFSTTVVLMAIVLSLRHPANACAQSVVEYVRDANGKKTSFVINVFDKITLQNESVRLVHLNWTDDMSRPADLEYVDKIRLTKYRGHNIEPRGYGTVSASRVKEIIYWEQLATKRAHASILAGRFDEAQQLFSKLEQVSPKWEFFDVALTLKCAKALLKSKPIARERVDEGLVLLHALSKNPLSKIRTFDHVVKEALTSAYIGLADEAFRDHEYQAGHDYIEKVEDVYPGSRAVNDFEQKIGAEVLKRLQRAEKLKEEGNVRAALDLLADTRRFAPLNLAAKKALERYLREYQVLKIACYEGAAEFDPFHATGTLERQISRLIFDSLFMADESGREFFKSPLVESFHATSLGTKYHFELKQDLRFADGQELRAQDIATTVDLLKNPNGATYDPVWDFYVRGVQVEDPFRFSVSLRQCPVTNSLFTFSITSLVGLEATKSRGQTGRTNPLGTGPFKIDETATGRTGDLQLKPNPYFREVEQGRPYIKEIGFHRYTKKGTGAAINDLERGDTHLLTDPSPLQLKRLQSANGFSSRPFLSNSVWALVFNHRKPMFQSRDMRRAFRLAIDRERILDQYFRQGLVGSNHAVITGPFPVHSNAYSRTVRFEQPDPDIARALLHNLQKRQISLKYPSGDIIIELAVQQIAKDLRAIGLDIVTEPKLPNDLIQEVALGHDFDVAYWRIDHNNVLFNLDSLFDVRKQALDRGGTNYMGYDDAELTQLFEDLRREQTGARIWNIQNRIHMHLHKEVVLAPLWWLESYIVHTNRLVGKTLQGKSTDLPLSRENVFRSTESWYLEPKE